LQGRYFAFRLHPFSIGEISRQGKAPDSRLLKSPKRWPEVESAKQDLVESLLEHGGFPEPFLHANARFTGRWRMARRERVLSQDLRDLSLVRDISLIEQLVELLTRRVGSPLSINSLRQDMESDHKTVAHWIELLERLYVVYRIPAYAGRLARALRKERKLYFWDWGEVPDPAARFENMVASHLLKYCHWMRDVGGVKMELSYLRDREKREVDFVLLKNGLPWAMIEAKLSDSRASANLRYFKERLGVGFAAQVIRSGRAGKDVFPAARFLAALP
jgi:predicted AAA+ superfamily ATPase